MLALGQGGDVVEPGVVRAQVAAAGEHQPPGPAIAQLVEAGEQPRHVARELRVGQLHQTGGRRDRFGQPAAIERSEVETVRVSSYLLQRESLPRAEQVTPRTEPDTEVDQPLRAAATQ